MNASHRPFNVLGDLASEFPGAHGRFRRNSGNAIVMGVCAGVADYFALDRTVVRLAALLLLWIFTVPTLLLYLLLTWIGDAR
jgi:phage shock protein C